MNEYKKKRMEAEKSGGQQSAPAQAPAADFSGASGDPYPF